MPLYALFLIPLALVFALRMIAMASRHDAADGRGRLNGFPRPTFIGLREHISRQIAIAGDLTSKDN